MRVHRALVVLLITAALQACAQSRLPSDWREGIATNYGQGSPYSPSFGTQDGSCGYGVLDKDTWPFWSVGALAEDNIFYGQGPIQGCGMCFEVECLDSNGQFAGRCNSNPASRTATIMITDACPECQSDQLDLQALTFAKLAPMDLGRIDIRYRRVQCVVPTDMSVNIDSNAGAGGWIRLEVKQVAGRGSIKTVQVKGADSEDWHSLNNLWGAAWETGTVPKPPLDFRVQDDMGVEVTALGVVQENGQTGKLPMGVNFRVTNGVVSFPKSFGASSSSAPAQAPSSSGSLQQQPPCVSAYEGANPGSSSSNCGGNANPSPPAGLPARADPSPPAPWWDKPPPPHPSPPPPPPPPTGGD